jgi:hypothetical protein
MNSSGEFGVGVGWDKNVMYNYVGRPQKCHYATIRDNILSTQFWVTGLLIMGKKNYLVV